jgi:uncharacterized membrane protein
MTSNRLEAFSDGVLAIIITIMVLEMRAPEEASLEALLPVLPVFVSYVISFIYLGIYWNNHHHLLQAVERVNGKVLWANLHLLFWLSLVPFVTSWVGEHHTMSLPVALYGVVLLMAAVAYRILELFLLKGDTGNRLLKEAVATGTKERVSTLLYVSAVPLAFVSGWISIGIYLFVAVLWFVPDRRLEKTLKK